MITQATASSILLQGGTILKHDADDQVHALQDTDLLIQGEIIAKIGVNLVAPPGAKVIDCHDKIISPGFVDTHHHVWQTQLKGRHSDDTLLDYTAKGNWQPFNYTARDVFWGELGGLLEAIDGGTTCIIDHAHMAYSPSHGQFLLCKHGRAVLTLMQGLQASRQP
jgi:cytosine/adenosine deaminase-related metal-dependent hydrolase